MYKAIILPLAKEEIRKSAHWYNKQQRGLGKRFTAQIRERISVLRKYPKIAPLRYDKVRTAVIDVFPFMIHYVVNDDKKQIVIAAVFHTSQDPNIWKDR